jgi:CubicO group peptidase (beta-lactamase class C family)
MSPGRAFNYNSGATELLAEVLRRCTGKTVDVLVQEELLQPLGISDVEWNRHFRNGNPQAAGALRARPRDFAKIGQLILDRGVWKELAIVSPSWIEESTTPHNNGPGQFLYGYQWWLGRSWCHETVIEWIGAMGWAGQRLIIVPALDMVVLVLAWLPERMNLPESILLNQYILPAIIHAQGRQPPRITGVDLRAAVPLRERRTARAHDFLSFERLNQSL